MNRGRWAIVAMVALACAVGALSVGLHHWISRRAIAWWGHDAVTLIVEAPQVAAWQLAPIDAGTSGGQAESTDTLVVGNARYRVVRRKDVSGLAGLDHLRHGLLEDLNFTWDAPLPDQPGQWRFAMEFHDGARRFVVAFDPVQRRLARADTGATLAIAPIATGWEDFFAEQFGAGKLQR